MGNQSDLPQATKPHTIRSIRTQSPRQPSWKPTPLPSPYPNPPKPTKTTFTSYVTSVHLLAVGVRLRSKRLACEVTNREETFAIIVRGREKIFEPSPIPPHKATTPSQRTVDKTVKYPIYDRSSRGSSLPTGDDLKKQFPKHVDCSL